MACVENNIIVSDSKCDLALKPYHMESCSVFSCPFWRYGQWSEVWGVEFRFIDVLLYFVLLTYFYTFSFVVFEAVIKIKIAFKKMTQG